MPEENLSKIMIESLGKGFKKIETHISWVLLDEKHAYKIKKPVKFWFLDFSTLEKRRHDCEEEVRLNSRFSPEIYLGVVPITKDPKGAFAFGDDGEAVEYAVKMVRLPDESSMEKLLSAGKIGPEQISAIVEKIVDFHGKTSRVFSADFDYAQTVKYLCENDLNMFMDVIKGSIELVERVRELKDKIDRFGKMNIQLFQRRQEAGKVRECHGDLHSKNIYFTDRPIFIDCIEFNKEMRFTDILWELAYFVMDVKKWGGSHVASEMMDEYFRMSGEERLDALMNFHSCHMALVLGKVAAMKNRENPSAGLAKDVFDYIELAEGFASKLS